MTQIAPPQDTQINAIKMPPHSVEAEQSVLGGLMLDNDAWYNVLEHVSETDFYRPEHRAIFHAISSLANRNMPFDVLTVTDTLKQNNDLSAARGEAYLFELAKNTPSAANILAYAKIVRERSVLRQLASVANEIAGSAYKPDGRSVLELLDHAEQRVFQITEQGSRDGGPVDINTIMANTLEKIDTLYQSKGELTGLSTGFKDLDSMTSGMQEADLVIVAARPSMGKTTLAMNIAENVALDLSSKQGSGAVLVFSLEMPAESLVMRMISSLGRIPQQNIRTGRLTDHDWPRITSTIAMFSESKLLIDDTPALSPSEMRARARRVAREHGGVSLIVVDYLQLMTVPGSNDNRVAEVAEISRSLKAIAKEFNCPVIAGSQLNRSLEQRQDKRPIMSDIRESGSIEQDADLILFIYRDEVYNKETAEKNHAEIIIGKHRNGPIGSFSLTFNGALSRFDNYVAQERYDNVPHQ
jgi:replicative DNA helicase